MTAVVAVLALVVMLLSVLVVSLLRSHAEILRALHDLGHDLDPSASDGPATGRGSGFDSRSGPDSRSGFDTVDGVPGPADALGRMARDIAGPTPSGDAVVLGMGGRGATLVAFLSSGCLTCHRFWSAFADGVALADGQRLVVATRGEESESPAALADLAAGLAPRGIPVVMSSDAWDDYGVPVAPYFVLVDGDRVVGEGAAAGWDQVLALLERARADQAAARDHADGDGAGGAGPVSRSRRSVLTGNRERIDADLAAAGIRPGDPRLHHLSPEDVGYHDAGTAGPGDGPRPGDRPGPVDRDVP